MYAHAYEYVILSINLLLWYQVVVSPRNYFLFTPLLPSCTVGTVDIRSIVEPIRFITRHKAREVKVYEAECTDIDPLNKTVTIAGRYHLHVVGDGCSMSNILL